MVTSKVRGLPSLRRSQVPVLLVLAMLVLAACGGSQQPPSGSNPPAGAATGAATPAQGPAAATGAAGAQSPAEGAKTETGAKTAPVHLRFATHSLQTGWYAYGAAMAEVLRPGLPKGSTVDVLPYAASIGNIQLLGTGEADMGLTMSLVASWAEKGINAFDGKAMPAIRALVGGLDNYYFVLLARKGSGITSLAQVLEKKMPVRVYTSEKGSLIAYAGQTVLESAGINPDELKKWGGSYTNVTQDAIISAVKEGRADLVIHMVNPGHPAVTELAASGAIEFRPMDAVVIDKMSKLGYEPVTQPANLFPGQTQALNTVGISTGIFTHKDLDTNLAYTITKLLSENQAKLAKSNKALAAYDPTKSWQPNRAGVQLHPGAEKFYREQGWMK